MYYFVGAAVVCIWVLFARFGGEEDVLSQKYFTILRLKKNTACPLYRRLMFDRKQPGRTRKMQSVFQEFNSSCTKGELKCAGGPSALFVYKIESAGELECNCASTCVCYCAPTCNCACNLYVYVCV